jgi:hypothetical protein
MKVTVTFWRDPRIMKLQVTVTWLALMKKNAPAICGGRKDSELLAFFTN